jgi:hypothetical protein
VQLKLEVLVAQHDMHKTTLGLVAEQLALMMPVDQLLAPSVSFNGAAVTREHAAFVLASPVQKGATLKSVWDYGKARIEYRFHSRSDAKPFDYLLTFDDATRLITGIVSFGI